MKTIRPTICFVLFITTALVHAATAQTQGSPPAEIKLVDLGFIAGLWQGELAGGLTEEHWSMPEGDNMIGMFRYVKEGKAIFYEFMLIEQTVNGPVLRLKHFNPGLIGWEEKAEVYSYPLLAFQPNNAVFERPDQQSRLTFQRTAGNTLLIVLEQKKPDGSQSKDEFKYTLKP